MKVMKRAAGIILLVLTAAVVLCGCAGKGKYVGTWCEEGSTREAFTLYSDGTCEISGEYGTGTWSIVNGKTLKLTNFYGETQTAQIEKADGKTLVLSEDGYTTTFEKTDG